jgi:hypothetical protein
MRTEQRGRGLHWALGSLQAFIGLGGVIGGLGLTLDPTGGDVGLDLSLLDSSPFDSFLVPGLVLLSVNGIGHLVGALCSFLRLELAGRLAIALGSFLIAWILTQVWWIGLVSWLQPLYLGFGLAEVLLGIAQARWRSRLGCDH